jgi:hypothetical protein
MNPHDMAQAGVSMLKQAVVQYLRQHPRTPSRAIRDELQLDSPNAQGNYGDTLLWGIMNQLTAEGRITCDDSGRRFLYFCVDG